MFFRSSSDRSVMCTARTARTDKGTESSLSAVPLTPGHRSGCLVSNLPAASQRIRRMVRRHTKALQDHHRQTRPLASLYHRTKRSPPIQARIVRRLRNPAELARKGLRMEEASSNFRSWSAGLGVSRVSTYGDSVSGDTEEGGVGEDMRTRVSRQKGLQRDADKESHVRIGKERERHRALIRP